MLDFRFCPAQTLETAGGCVCVCVGVCVCVQGRLTDWSVVVIRKAIQLDTTFYTYTLGLDVAD